MDKFSNSLLKWYYKNRRVLPFRETPTPYHVWVSEIMLQQTRVGAALPYYRRFMQALPDVATLAACPEEQLLKLWEGLGYYSRARNLQKAARAVMELHGGVIPDSYTALLALPGVGPYTAGAIASIAFGLPEVAVDGNVLRVFARLLACSEGITAPDVKQRLTEEVRRRQPQNAPGDFNQALMELGALVCLPKTPHCAACPLRSQCAACAQNVQASLPRRTAKPQKPVLPMTGFVVLRGHDVLLQRRPPKGLLAGMWQPPMFDGAMSEKEAAQALEKLVPGAALGAALPAARHVFTHKVWALCGWLCHAPANAPAAEGCFFATESQLATQYTLPSAFKAWLPLMRPQAEPPPFPPFSA